MRAFVAGGAFLREMPINAVMPDCELDRPSQVSAVQL